MVVVGLVRLGQMVVVFLTAWEATELQIVFLVLQHFMQAVVVGQVLVWVQLLEDQVVEVLVLVVVRPVLARLALQTLAAAAAEVT